MRLFLFVLILFPITFCEAQIPECFDSTALRSEKLFIDSNAYNEWPVLAMSKISNDGKYFGLVNRISAAKHMLILLSTCKAWRFESPIVGTFVFSADNRKAIWIDDKRRLCVLDLGVRHVQFISDVVEYTLVDGYLIYRLHDDNDSYILMNLRTSELYIYPSTIFYLMNSIGRYRILHQRKGEDSLRMEIFGSEVDRKSVVWMADSVRCVVRSDDGSQIAFMRKSNAATGIELMYYSEGMDTAYSIATGDSISISNLVRFSKDGRWLFVNLIDRRMKDTIANSKNVIIWSYRDFNLRSSEGANKSTQHYNAAIRISDHRIVRLDQNNDWIDFPRLQDSVVLICHKQLGNLNNEANWNTANIVKWSVLSVEEGVKVPLDSIHGDEFVQFSLSGKFIVYFDDFSKNFFSYEVGTRKIVNITNGIEDNWRKDINNDSYGRSIGGWELNDAAVYLYGQRDIWKIDPTGKKVPINVTNGYGKKHDIVFFLALTEYSQRYVLRKESLILTAFDLQTKNNGFFRKRVDKGGDPELLTMGPYIYDVTDNPCIPYDLNYSPIRALNANRYIVRRMSGTEFPNFFFTRDFKKFKRLTTIQPERKYNWYKPELREWTSLGGAFLHGILYKPENFDSSRRYPVILYFYEKLSDRLNAYLAPNPLDNGCSINIPYYVSNEYIVFTPDIYYRPGFPMESAYESVVSAVKYLGSLSYVNSNKIGIQGCSWGAIQINYLVTHCNLFAAACSASGIGNWISGYNSLLENGMSMQALYESGQMRMNKTLWDNRNGFVENSAVFNASNITTPILFMHTYGDGICPFINIAEFFFILRGLEKKSWMLIYQGNHGVWREAGMDFSLRMKEFFDHFLKDKPAAEWMSAKDRK